MKTCRSHRFFFLTRLTGAITVVLWAMSQSIPTHHLPTPPAYTLEVLTLPGYKNSTAVAVNATGTVVGYAWNDNEFLDAQPWVWDMGVCANCRFPAT